MSPNASPTSAQFPRRTLLLSLLLVVATALSFLLGAHVEGRPETPAKSSTKPKKVSSIPTPSSVPQDVLGVVDGIPIQQSEWDRLAKPYFEEVQARAGRPLNDEEKRLLRRNVLDELIRERLWLADARRRGIKISEAAIDARMMQSDFFKTNGRADESKFLAYKRSPTSNYPVLRAEVERSLLLEEYVRWMERRFGPRESELRKAFEERTTQAAIRYFLLTPEDVSLDPEATPAQIRAYYDAHPDEFQSADEAGIQYIRVPAAPEGAPADSAQAALRKANEVLSAIKAGAPAETAAKPYGGLHDPGPFRLGEPIRGLGRSEALVAAVGATEPGAWIGEPIRVGPYWVVAKVTERRRARRLPFLEVVPQAKRKADVTVRDETLDSLARAEVRAHPQKYFARQIEAAIVSRALISLDAGPPPTRREVERRLETLRKDLNISEGDRAWADSTAATIPALIRSERRMATGMKLMREAAARLAKKETPARVASKYLAVSTLFQMYEGEPPTRHLLVEGKLLDSLYALRPGAVLGPRVKDDSIFVVRVEALKTDFLPPYEAVRAEAKAAVLEERRAKTAAEAEQWFHGRRASYHTATRWVLDYVVFPKPKPEQVTVPEDSIASYWRARPLEFTQPGKAHVRHILIRVPEGQPRGPAREKALAARKRILAGEGFAAVAKEVSEDTASAARGGDLGEMTRGSVVKELGDTAFAIPIGELSEPVETRFGVHILRVDERTPERLRPLEECRDEIRGVLVTQMADSLAYRAAAIFARAASDSGASFDSLAARHGGAVRSEPLAPGGNLPGVGRATWVEPTIASLPDGGVTASPIPVPDGYLVARRVREVPPEEAEFQDVRDRVISDYQMVRKREVADSLNARLKAAIRNGADPETLFIALGGLHPSRLFGRQGPIPELQRDPALARDSTFMERIFSAKPGTVLPPVTGSVGTLYAKVDTVTILAPSDFAKQREALLRELVDRRVEAWTSRLRAKAKIRIHRKDLQALMS